MAFWTTEHLKLLSYTLDMQHCSTVFSPITSHYPAAFPPFTMSTWTTQNYMCNCSLPFKQNTFIHCIKVLKRGKLLFSSVDLVKLIHGPRHCCSSKMHHIFLNRGLRAYLDNYASDFSKKVPFSTFFASVLFF